MLTHAPNLLRNYLAELREQNVDSPEIQTMIMRPSRDNF